MDVNDIIRKEASRRKLSPKTIKTYQHCVKNFFKYCDKEPSKVSKLDVRKYLNEKFVEINAPGNTINVYLNALKFFFEECLNKKMRLNIKYSKTPRNLPVVLTQNEIKKLIDCIDNKKHRLMIETMYSAGMRVSELINLKIKDLELEENQGWIRAGKGNKDRPFIIANKIKERIKKLIIRDVLKENDFLFNSNRMGKYSVKSMQEVVKKARKKAKIGKSVSPHTLRHSFATHLIENGYSVSEVQGLLGHSSLDTTMIYVHLARPKILNIKSPLDDLK